MIPRSGSNHCTQQAATFLLGSLLVQFFGGILLTMFLHQNAHATAILETGVFLLTALATQQLFGQEKGRYAPLGVCILGMLWAWIKVVFPMQSFVSGIAANLFLLAIFIPLQWQIDVACVKINASKATRKLGRRWIFWMCIGRIASIAGYVLAGNSSPSDGNTSGAFSLLSRVTLGLEIIALIAVVGSYIYQIRYLWRVKGIFKE